MVDHYIGYLIWSVVLEPHKRELKLTKLPAFVTALAITGPDHLNRHKLIFSVIYIMTRNLEHTGLVRPRKTISNGSIQKITFYIPQLHATIISSFVFCWVTLIVIICRIDVCLIVLMSVRKCIFSRKRLQSGLQVTYIEWSWSCDATSTRGAHRTRCVLENGWICATRQVRGCF